MVDNVTFLVSKKRRGRLVKKCSISVEIDLSPKCGTQLKTHIQNECLGMFFSFFVGLKVFFFFGFLGRGIPPRILGGDSRNPRLFPLFQHWEHVDFSDV